MRGLCWWIALVLVSCGRSGLELGDGLGDDDSVSRGGSGASGDDGESGGTGQTGGAPATGGQVAGGVGGAGGTGGSAVGGNGAVPTGGASGSGGEIEPPIDPGGPIPDCGRVPPRSEPLELRRWLYLESERQDNGTARYLIEITPSGAQNLTRLTDFGEASALGGWSGDGRYFAFTRNSRLPSASVEIVDVSGEGAPVPVQMPERNGLVRWAPVDARYFVRVRAASTGTASVLTVVDVPTGAEQSVELAPFIDAEAWSPDGRYIALLSSIAGALLIDTLETPLVVRSLHDRASEFPRWSPDGRYLAFVSESLLHVYDTLRETQFVHDVRIVGDVEWDVAWYRNEWLSFTTVNGGTFFLDLSVEPPSPVPLDGQPDPGDVSPGARCVAYRGRCEATRQNGYCVRALPPDPERPAVQIGRDEWWSFWGDSGDQLLLDNPAAEPVRTLTHVELRGGQLLRQSVLEGYKTFEGIVRWNPGGHSDWVAYEGLDLHSSILHARLWHRETRETFSVDIGTGFERLSSWSPDGRYLAVGSDTDISDGPVADFESVLYVQEVLDGELGANFRVDAVTDALDGGIWDFIWQP